MNEEKSVFLSVLEDSELSREGKLIKLKAHWKSLSGEDDGPEEELALSRDPSRQQAYVASLKSLSDLMTDLKMKKRVAVGSFSLEDLIHFLVETDVICFTVRILKRKLWDPRTVNAECTKNASNGISNSCVQAAKEKNLWYSPVHYYCCDILNSVSLQMYVSVDRKLIEYLQKILDAKAVKALARFIDLSYPSPLAAVSALHSLDYICERNFQACNRLSQVEGLLKKLTDFLYKETSFKFFKLWYGKGVSPYEEEALTVHNSLIFPDVRLDRENVYTEQVPFKRITMEKTLIRLGHVVLQHSVKIVGHIAGNTHHRNKNFVLKEPELVKTLIKWFKAPMIRADDLAMIITCIRTMRKFATRKELSTLIVEKFNFIKAFEVGIRTPIRELLVGYLDVINKLAIQKEFRKIIIANKIIAETLAAYCHSTTQIQESILECIGKLTDGEEAQEFFPYLDLKQLYMLKKSHNKSTKVLEKIQVIEANYERYAASASQFQEQRRRINSNKVRLPNSIEESHNLKELGNNKFKSFAISDALDLYERALSECPLTQSGSWHVLPAQLYCNIALCHLQVSEWQSAVRAATNAIARSYENMPKAAGIYLKAVFRRSKAFYELKMYHRALMDAAQCMICDSDNVAMAQHYQKTIAAYRQCGGVEPIRRCDICFEGEGSKLKRCARCEAACYCSARCQTRAWEQYSHRNYCTPPPH